MRTRYLIMHKDAWTYTMAGTVLGAFGLLLRWLQWEIIYDETSGLPAPNAPVSWLLVLFLAGMAAALPGVIAASTTLPVIGVPIKGMLDGLDAMLSIIQMPPGIPVATVGVNGAQNAAILAVEMLALGDAAIAQRLAVYKGSLRVKIEKANKELSEIKYEYKTN